ncbi:hypothetical protein A2Y85_06940 [candidate division WOR-3 bacterium RBG_13_43_14]|uniref:POTRA domain-containing protein n=1 Tax=candidate division WOR-3 bacterium RBG_13_43_14 TaxID=1802590 RepID=A0A1F4UAW1_UNCW3|nr:MAG: hypothetical protein A2Y85_06940 [candidate division WOR-3 bacterium RBG_13_43_14]
MRKYQFYIISALLIAAIAGNTESVLIEAEGNNFFSDNYLSGFLNRKRHRDIESVIQKILYLYNNTGYPFCRVEPEVVRETSESTKIILHIHEGAHVTITDYLYSSTGRTSDRILKKFAGGKTNSPFSLRIVNNIKNKLLRTGIFEKIVENIVQQEDRYYLRVDIQERKSDFISLLGSYGEDNLNIFASIFTRNLLGTLRGLQFDYEQEKTFSLFYHDPISIIPITIDGKFSLLTEDSARLTEFGGRILVPVNRFIDIGISSGYESASNKIDTNANYRSNSAGLTAILHYQDPLISLESNADFDYLFRTIDRRRFLYNGSIDIKRLLIAFHYRFVWTDSFNYFDYYRIGGAHNLRGYREDEFFARKARWFTIEYHRLPVFPMIDIGYVNDDFLFSYGFGIKAQNRLADATLIVAWPRAKNWREGKIHLLLITGF